MAQFNIKELVAKAHFDYVGPAFPAWWENNKRLFIFPDLNNISADLLNGNKYFMTLKLRDSDGNTYELPNEPLVSFTESKTIEETATVGTKRRGTVKEYITTNDVQMSIRGICFDPENPEQYPASQVRNLQRLYARNESLEVVGNKLFELMGVRNVVLYDKGYPEMVGQQGLQRYEFFAVSDQDFFAELNERDQFLS